MSVANNSHNATPVSVDPVALFVCRGCRPHNAPRDGTHPGQELVHLVERSVVNREASAQIVVLPVHCLSRCDASCAAAILPPDGPTVIFEQLSHTSTTADALVAVALEVQRRGRVAATQDELLSQLSAAKAR